MALVIKTAPPKLKLAGEMMRPASASNSTTAGVNGGLGHWNSPVPYLFGGLGLVIGLISIALLLLACSYRNTSPNSAAEGEEKTSGQNKQVEMQMEMEPKIVVIMAGDDNPSYLAKPVSCSYCQHNEQV